MVDGSTGINVCVTKSLPLIVVVLPPCLQEDRSEGDVFMLIINKSVLMVGLTWS